MLKMTSNSKCPRCSGNMFVYDDEVSCFACGYVEYFDIPKKSLPNPFEDNLNEGYHLRSASKKTLSKRSLIDIQTILKTH